MPMMGAKAPIANSKTEKAGFDARAVESACASLALSVASSNQQQFDALVLALQSMMPPSTSQDYPSVLPLSPDAELRREDFVYQAYHFLGGQDDNLKALQGFEADFARRVTASTQGFQDPSLLAGALDLACAFIKNYAIDKADRIYTKIAPYCMARGLPWDVKCLQDMATLRCKQSRQAEAAKLLEQVAARTSPHPATFRNLGTVYNQLGQYEKAKGFFEAAVQLNKEKSEDKDDLWNLGLVKKNMGDLQGAVIMLEAALEAWKRDEPDDDCTIAKVHDSVGGCYHAIGRYQDAIDQYSQARLLFSRSVGPDSPLYGCSCEGLARACLAAESYEDGFDALVEALTVHATKDAIHPTPLFELLRLALEDFTAPGRLRAQELARLESPITIAVKSLRARGIDDDANAGVLFESMAQALIKCSTSQDEASVRRRNFARSLLIQAEPLVQSATDTGLADLSHISALITLELQVLDKVDEARTGC